MGRKVLRLDLLPACSDCGLVLRVHGVVGRCVAAVDGVVEGAAKGFCCALDGNGQNMRGNKGESVRTYVNASCRCSQVGHGALLLCDMFALLLWCVARAVWYRSTWILLRLLLPRFVVLSCWYLAWYTWWWRS